MTRSASLRLSGLALALAAIVAVAGDGVRAGEAGPGLQVAQTSTRHQQLFRNIDGNGDGALSREEYMAYRGRVFGGMDADGQGSLSQDEFMAGGPGGQTMTKRHRVRREEMFRALNRGGSGAISRPEWDREGEELFNLRDRNGDGNIMPEEFGPLMRHGMPM